MSDDCRKAFEAQNPKSILWRRGGGPMAELVPTDEYVDSGVQARWVDWKRAWAAAVATQADEIERLRAERRRPTPALERFQECCGSEDPLPLERLRFFCSLAMGGQDWLDVEPFFDAVSAELAQAQAERDAAVAAVVRYVRVYDRLFRRYGPGDATALFSELGAAETERENALAALRALAAPSGGEKK